MAIYYEQKRRQAVPPTPEKQSTGVQKFKSAVKTGYQGSQIYDARIKEQVDNTINFKETADIGGKTKQIFDSEGMPTSTLSDSGKSIHIYKKEQTGPFAGKGARVKINPKIWDALEDTYDLSDPDNPLAGVADPEAWDIVSDFNPLEIETDLRESGWSNQDISEVFGFDSPDEFNAWKVNPENPHAHFWSEEAGADFGYIEAENLGKYRDANLGSSFIHEGYDSAGNLVALDENISGVDVNRWWDAPFTLEKGGPREFLDYANLPEGHPNKTAGIPHPWKNRNIIATHNQQEWNFSLSSGYNPDLAAQSFYDNNPGIKKVFEEIGIDTDGGPNWNYPVTSGVNHDLYSEVVYSLDDDNLRNFATGESTFDFGRSSVSYKSGGIVNEYGMINVDTINEYLVQQNRAPLTDVQIALIEEDINNYGLLSRDDAIDFVGERVALGEEYLTPTDETGFFGNVIKFGKNVQKWKTSPIGGEWTTVAEPIVKAEGQEIAAAGTGKFGASEKVFKLESTAIPEEGINAIEIPLSKEGAGFFGKTFGTPFAARQAAKAAGATAAETAAAGGAAITPIGWAAIAAGVLEVVDELDVPVLSDMFDAFGDIFDDIF